MFFATFVREKFLTSGLFNTPAISWDFVETSGVHKALAARLERLRKQRIIGAYSVDLQEGIARFELSGTGPTREAHLRLDLVNSFADAESEATFLSEKVNIAAQSQLLFIGSPQIVSTCRDDFNAGMATLASLPPDSAPATRKWSYFQTIGLQGGISQQPTAPSTPPPNATPCAYGAGIVTPCNNRVA
ncbi:MAG: hypothetical protein EBZ48_11070, partial [Proteobacteria bacterium]|nr:hypothetical protein [Pseudomonadota bacterium]